MADTLYSKIREKPFITLCIIITVIYLACVGTFIACTFTYNPPKNLEIATGQVAKFNYNDKTNIIDQIVNSSEFFNVTLDDDSFYEAQGINFDNIDKELFNDIALNTRITITYQDRGISAPNRIFGIVYNGKTYLNKEDVFADLNEESKKAHIIFPVLIGIVTVFAVGLILLCNQKFNKKQNNNPT